MATVDSSRRPGVVIQEGLQNTLWIPRVLRNPDQLDNIFLPILIGPQLGGKGLAPVCGGVQLRALEELPKALDDLLPLGLLLSCLACQCPFCLPHSAKALWVSGQGPWLQQLWLSSCKRGSRIRLRDTADLNPKYVNDFIGFRAC